MVTIIGCPTQCQFRQVTGTDDHAAGFIGEIHQHLRALTRLTVFNAGEGLPEDELPKIWEKFYRTDRARTREAGGTGIGLSLVRAIADTLHGDCGAENVPGGIAFWFDIPDAPPQTE